MYTIMTAHRVKVINLVTLAWLVTGCGSSGSDTNAAEDTSISLSLTSLELSTTPGGPAINVSGLPIVSKRVVLQQNAGKSQ